MRIAYKNYVDLITSGSIIASTEDPAFPIENIQEQRKVVTWRTTAVTAQSIIVDLGGAIAIDTCMLLGHNLTSSATIVLYAATSNSWVGATSQTITYNADMILKFFTAQTYQWFKIEIDDQTNPDGYIEIGRFWLGDYITISPSSLVDFTVKKNRSDNVMHNKTRQKYASIGNTWREFNLQFPPTASTMVDLIEDMFDYVGNHSSFIFCNFDTLRGYTLVEPCYVSIVDDSLSFGHDENNKWNWSLNLMEEL